MASEPTSTQAWLSLASRAAENSMPARPFDAFLRRLLSRAGETLNTGWEDVLIPQGMALGALAGDEAMHEWVKAWASRHTELHSPELGKCDYGIYSGADYHGVRLAAYCGDWGMPLVLAPLYLHTKNEAYREQAAAICDHILAHSPRLPCGGIAHGDWDPVVSERLWVDTLYYTASPLAWTHRITGDQHYAEEAIRQCLAHARVLQDPQTGLFFHDAVPDSTNRSDFFWSRGNGWVIMAFLDTLLYCPRESPGWREIMDSYRRLVTGLLQRQHPCGLWRIVPGDDESHLETSGTAMILTGLLGGIENGLVPPESLQRVRRGLRELSTWIKGDGALVGAQRPAGLGGWESHKLSTLGECTYASGVFLRLLTLAAQSQSLRS